VYIAGEQVWIYDRSGKLAGVLEIPERRGLAHAVLGKELEAG